MYAMIFMDNHFAIRRKLAALYAHEEFSHPPKLGRNNQN